MICSSRNSVLKTLKVYLKLFPRLKILNLRAPALNRADQRHNWCRACVPASASSSNFSLTGNQSILYSSRWSRRRRAARALCAALGEFFLCNFACQYNYEQDLWFPALLSGPLFRASNKIGDAKLEWKTHSCRFDECERAEPRTSLVMQPLRPCVPRVAYFHRFISWQHVTFTSIEITMMICNSFGGP